MSDLDPFMKHGFKRSDAFDPKLGLSHSQVTVLGVHAKFREWGEAKEVMVPWGQLDYWNIIATSENIGDDEPQQFEDNRSLHQEIAVEEDKEKNAWRIKARCFFSFWMPPNLPSEPGLTLRVRALVVLK